MRSGIPWDGAGRIPSQLATQRAAAFPVEHAVAEGVLDDRRDFGHARQQGRTPCRCEDMELGIRVLLAQPQQQRLHHDGVADP